MKTMTRDEANAQLFKAAASGGVVEAQAALDAGADVSSKSFGSSLKPLMVRLTLPGGTRQRGQLPNKNGLFKMTLSAISLVCHHLQKHAFGERCKSRRAKVAWTICQNACFNYMCRAE